MFLRIRSADILLIVAAFSMLLAGCGLFEVGEDKYFDNTALARGRILVAIHDSANPDAELGLYTLDVMASNEIRLFASADFDFTGPSISGNTGRYIGFGRTQLELLDTFSKDSQRVAGFGAEQRALAFDRQSPVRLAYMDGSTSTGFNIAVQLSLTAEPAAITSDASESVSCWTPAWSPDGQWIIYARITGTANPTGQLWRVRPDGSEAEALPITTTELPTYAIFSPDGTEVLVPGDFTSYKIDDGRVGKIDHIRETDTFQQQLADMGYELVGSPVTGAVHTGDTVTSFRHTFPISAYWATGDWIYFDALVASNYGTPPHPVLGVAIFSWLRISQRLFQHMLPVPLSEARTEGHAISVLHPTVIP